MEENKDQNPNPNPVPEGEGKVTPQSSPEIPKISQAPPLSSKPEAKQPHPKKPEQVVKAPHKPKKGMSPRALLFGFFGIGILLVFVFYGIMLWGLLSGNVSNPLFETLGIKPEELQDVLLVVTNSIFGLGALFFLFASLIRFFQWVMMDSKSVNKKPTIKKVGLNFFFFVFACGLWVFFFWLITGAQVKKELKEDIEMIQTKPPIVIGLTSPVKIEFDIGTNLYGKMDPSLIRQINWDFEGDGENDASGPIVTHRFLDKGENNGRFPVRAEVVYYSPGEDKERIFTSLREVIVANEAVVASFTATPERGPVPLKVTFDAFHSKDPDGQIIKYEWDLEGDEAFEFPSEESTIEREFFKIGEVKVRLQVTGSNHDTAIHEKTIIVTEPEEKLRAEISSDVGFEGIAPFQVILDGGQSFSRMGKIVRYEWRIEGEDKVYVGRKFQRTFREQGEYKITLTIQNEQDEKDQATETLRVYKKKKEAKMKIRTTPPIDPKTEVLIGEEPLTVTFDSTLSVVQDPVEWKWDFENDGIVDESGAIIQHTFRETGEYDTKLIIIDSEEDEYEYIQKVLVERAGVRAKVVATPSAGPVPLRVEFDGSGSSADEGEIIDYIWEMPAAEPVHYGAKITYELTDVGIFPVKLTILTSTGRTAETEILVSAREEGVYADFAFTPTGGEAPLKVKFNPTNSTGAIVNYFWEFGDGVTSHKFLPQHVYEDPGEYEVILKVKDRNNVVSEMKKTIVVTD